MMKLSRMTLRLPEDLADWYSGSAVRNAASLNSELVRALREKMDMQIQREGRKLPA